MDISEEETNPRDILKKFVGVKIQIQMDIQKQLKYLFIS